MTTPPTSHYTPLPDVDAGRVLAHLSDQDAAIALDEAVIDELQELVDARYRTLAQRRTQRLAFLERFCSYTPPIP